MTELNLDNPKEFEEFEKNYDFSSIKFSFNMKDTNYSLDVIQNQLLQMYLISDKRFRRAFNTNFTSYLVTYLKDKMRLNEPVRLSIMGIVRGGKSSTAITLAILHQAMMHRLFHPSYICSGEMEYLEKLQTFPKEKLVNKTFVIDEHQDRFGVGSTAKKMKLENTQSIIAKNNISTIFITPHFFSDKTADYGIRMFGKCSFTKSCRGMLYNLQEKTNGTPVGNIYLPIFNELMKNPYGEWLNKKYLEKKDNWIDKERRGEGDANEMLKKKMAINFVHDPKFMALKTKAMRLNFITLKLGDNWTSGEKEIIEGYTNLLRQGAIDENEFER
jgi:hypothetical protein